LPLGVGGSVLALLVGIANQVVVLMEVEVLRRVLKRLLVDTSAPAGIGAGRRAAD
jgi:hypothetical protein